ncbi:MULTISPECIES: site-specific DNA-methyltransferase [Vibrio]|uniref:site-specific DNA-methyltransferase n=1 Tax=Vibrio TaxID=662 RepID=UPI000CE9910C|nr:MULTISPECIES: site-specific DNA-methyltransferase [Vibrio]AVF74057.1 type III restriction endonuclease subunit M [Vibrio alginolyticus]MBS9947106.1 site-specific DNA-methyltransferase [Vibrio alginolyticus]MDG2635127.1 site-specific DNA-methyltransferase [Vibrio parahaemolyticus]MDW2319993.1 site-specific DNA-methyltransferase [Vibrio sp. 1159]HCG5128060.1 site-specific DNA-methyltransferase [Vibrio parahaemolyticus]
MNKETLFSNTETANSKQLEILQKHFPQCFDKQGNFIQEKLLEVVKSSDVELSKESYSLNWLGKSYARLLTNLPPKTLLHEDKQHNHLESNKDSQNLLIKGDNLEVLKHMVNAYSEKVKMIYIDPPYNTGSDGFVYNDDRKFTPQQLSELAGIDLDEATRILDFTAKGSSSHSAWLTFMYPRLYVARELMLDDGVIFISIDDNEYGQLKILCDEIFGESNFVANFIWEKRTNRENRKVVSSRHDYVLCYSKSKNSSKRIISQLPMNEKALANYKNPDNDPNGPWKSDPATAQAGHGTKTQFYDLIAPNGKTHKLESGRCWLFTESVMAEKIKNGNMWFGRDGNGVPRLKTYLHSKERGLTPESILFSDLVGTNESAKNQLKKLFDDKAVFETPKPVELLEVLIQLALPEGLVLDFFSGSGTIAQAVFEQNAKSNSSNRNFIAIQLDETCQKDSEGYKAGYRSIFDITKDRLLKASNKIRKEYPDYQGDLGFKVFETNEDFRVKDEGELTLENLSFFDDVVLTDEQYNTLLTTWCVYDGSLLTTPIQDVDLNGYTAHLCDKRLYLIAPNFNSETIKALLHELDNNKDFEPNKVVFYGNNFDSAKQMELNEALKGYANKKSLEIDLVVRN